jgi:hypothetical protein
MSETVFLVATAHAIPVIIGRVIAGKKGAFTAAFFTFLFAGFVGGLRYFIFDIVAVAIALYVCLKIGDEK